MQRARTKQQPVPQQGSRHHRLQLSPSVDKGCAEELPRHAVPHDRERIGITDTRPLHHAVGLLDRRPVELGQGIHRPIVPLQCLRQRPCPLGIKPRKHMGYSETHAILLRTVHLDGLGLHRRTHTVWIPSTKQLLRHNRPRRIPQGLLLYVSE